jgi:MFS family permease
MASSVRNYLIVTASYWGITLVDGALRMLVLFHFSKLGYSPFTLAFLFLLYEFAGIIANLGGGWLASRFGIPRMLAIGQSLQIIGLLMLSLLDPAWTAAASVGWVVGAQGIAGVAKDLTKTASKSAIKATSVEGSSQLFKWVAWFTGSKNAMKGVGFFAGALLLDTVGFRYALWMMAALLAVIFAAGLLSLPRELGKAKSSKTVRELFGKSRAVNLLAFARIFLFGARDVWFVVGRLWRCAGDRAHVRQAQPGRLERRSTSSAALVTHFGDAAISTCSHLDDAECTPARSHYRRGPGGVRIALCGQLLAAFLFDPGLCWIREGCRRCRLLLRSERDRPSRRHHAVGHPLSGWWHDSLPVGISCHAGRMLAGHVAAAELSSCGRDG